LKNFFNVKNNYERYAILTPESKKDLRSE